MVSLMTSNGPVKRLNCPKRPTFGPNYQGSEDRLLFGIWKSCLELDQTPPGPQIIPSNIEYPYGGISNIEHNRGRLL